MTSKPSFGTPCILGLLVGLGVLTACQEPRLTDPIQGGLIDEAQLKGSIAGLVSDSTGLPLSGVLITARSADGKGYTSTSDAQGAYRVPDLPGGQYTLSFQVRNYADTTLKGIQLAIDQDRRKVNMQLRFKGDSVGNIVDSLLRVRDISGSLQNASGVQKVALSARNSEGDTVPVLAATWNAAGQSYSAQMSVPRVGGLLTVRVYNGQSQLTGLKQIAFDSTNNLVQVPSFSALNAMPWIQAGRDTVVLQNQEVVLTGLFKDSLGTVAKVDSVEWSADQKVWTKISGISDSSFQLKWTPGTTDSNRTLWFRATDGDGNRQVDSLVVRTIPVPKFSPTLALGTFSMGSSALYGMTARPEHQVTLTRSFKMAQTEVTRKQFQAFLQHLADVDSLVVDSFGDWSTKSGEFLGSNDFGAFSFQSAKVSIVSTPDAPATGISWHGAVRYANWLNAKAGFANPYDPNSATLNATLAGYRLPTEAEWEYAAKSGQNLKFAGSDMAAEVAWFKTNSSGLKAVNSLKANAWGIYDLSGNASEWVLDAYSNLNGTNVTNPWISGSGNRVLKGGAYDSDSLSGSALYPANAQSLNPNLMEARVGFRLVYQTGTAALARGMRP
jgi:sulfatase modifying factor 1